MLLQVTRKLMIILVLLAIVVVPRQHLRPPLGLT